MSQSIRPERDHVFDNMRAIAIICVVIIHSVYGYEVTSGEQLIANWLGTFTRPCIALFLFAAGFFFPLDMSTTQLVRRIKRVIVPYLVFSFIAILYQTRIIHFFEAVTQHPWEIISNIIIGNTWGIYWFIPVIVINYLLGFWLAHSPRQRIIWITVTLFAVNLIHAAYYNTIINHFGINNNPIIWLYNYRLYISWPFYFFFGILTREYQIQNILRSHRATVFLLWALIFITYNVLFFTQIVEPGGYNSIIDTIASIAAISMILTTRFNSNPLRFIGETSYTTYLLHYFIISFTSRIAVNYFGKPPFWFSFVLFFAALGGSLVFAWIMRRVLGRHSRVVFGS